MAQSVTARRLLRRLALLFAVAGGSLRTIPMAALRLPEARCNVYLLKNLQSNDMTTVANELCIDLAPYRSPDRRPAPLVSEEEIEAIELVEEIPLPTAHGVGLSALENLLDEFAAVRPPTRDRLTAAAIEDLLNAFRRVAAPHPEDLTLARASQSG